MGCTKSLTNSRTRAAGSWHLCSAADGTPQQSTEHAVRPRAHADCVPQLGCMQTCLACTGVVLQACTTCLVHLTTNRSGLDVWPEGSKWQAKLCRPRWAWRKLAPEQPPCSGLCKRISHAMHWVMCQCLRLSYCVHILTQQHRQPAAAHVACWGPPLLPLVMEQHWLSPSNSQLAQASHSFVIYISWVCVSGRHAMTALHAPEESTSPWKPRAAQRSWGALPGWCLQCSSPAQARPSCPEWTTCGIAQCPGTCWPSLYIPAACSSAWTGAQAPFVQDPARAWALRACRVDS